MADQINPEPEDIEFDEIRVLKTDETAWIRVDEVFIDASRIQAVGVDEDGSVRFMLEDDVAVAAAKSVSDGGMTLEDAMSLIVDATTDDDDDND